MLLKVLGSAAGGGFPQWNCNYRLSRAVRRGEEGLRPRTQSSLAACANGRDWVLFNASPDIRSQIDATPELQPPQEGKLRGTPIRAVVLTNADVDHIAGLLSLRERERFVIYATARVLEVLEQNTIFNVLDPHYVERRLLPLEGVIPIADSDGQSTGILVETFPVSGKIALFLEDSDRADEGFGTEEGDTVGLRIFEADVGSSAFYIPGCAAVDGKLKARLAGAACLFFDGTVFTDDEMPVAGVGSKTGKRMGHLQISGAQGSMALLADVPVARRIYVHINNTNPILDERSSEHQEVRMNGWEIGHDGMEIRL
ncbi:MAG: pyrroloquinoline quinone biosynthesis protein PqqB [Rhizobiaceae bacterium]|nr:pyrroloquinoline quinone biosynthesis protein PqqB [Rhizobiaceae bacterium]